jgi:hypothetical protein
MPRKSAADLGIAAVPPRLSCPPEMAEGSPARLLFLRLAATCDHLEESDAPLLGLYCDAVALAQKAATALQAGTEERRWTETYRTATLSAKALAAALKLSPRGRNHNFRSRAARSGPANAYEVLGLSGETPWGKL